jgi:predicted acyl esterase
MPVTVEDHTVTAPDGTDLAVTLYTPDTRDPNPAILVTHGTRFTPDPPPVRRSSLRSTGTHTVTWLPMITSTGPVIT